MFVVAMKQSKWTARTQTYFLVYAETMRRWRRIIISATFQSTVNDQSLLSMVSALDTDEGSCKILPAALQSFVIGLLPQLRLFNSVSRLSLNLEGDGKGSFIENSQEVEATEDLLEKEMMNEEQFLRDVPDLDCKTFLESDVAVVSRVSSTFYEVMVHGQRYTERKAPFASSGRDGENAFEDFMKDLKLAIRLQKCSGIASFIGVVLDDSRTYLRSYLFESPAISNLTRLLNLANSGNERIPWSVRELWSQQIVNAVAEVHKGQVTLGTLTRQSFALRANGEVILTRVHASYAHMVDEKGQMPPELRVPSAGGHGPCQTTNYRTDIFQLGFILWLLAEHRPHITAYMCAISACTTSPRFKCTAEHTNPVAMPPCSRDVPPYFAEMIEKCRSPDPRARPTAHELAESFPSKRDLTQELSTIVTSFAARVNRSYFCTHCDNCGTICRNLHYHCNACSLGGFDLCPPCFEQYRGCFDPSHRLMKRAVRDGKLIDVS